MKLLLFAALLHLVAAGHKGNDEFGLVDKPVMLEPRVACGSRLPPCPKGAYCLPNKACFYEDQKKCHGTCAKENKYEECRDKDHPIKRCAVDDRECIDDYRNRDSCGTMCGAPGICVPRWLPHCKTGWKSDCPEGTWCYPDYKGGCKLGQAGCDGRCL
ncbi:hypothetical protein HJFPF1_08013 [Paramyrothecium foliicola]|nr:hypothetical protein HJFPF1_08013 [Paramyrothecium foliicola]